MLPRRQNTIPISARARKQPLRAAKSFWLAGPEPRTRRKSSGKRRLFHPPPIFHPAVELCAFENVSSSLNGCRRLFVCVIICRSNL